MPEEKENGEKELGEDQKEKEEEEKIEIEKQEKEEEEKKKKEALKAKAEEKKKKAKAKAKAKSRKKKEPSLIGKKIVMKMTLGTPKTCFLAGKSFVVGKDLSVETAQAWLNSGAAELIGDLPSPSEFK